MKIILDNIGKKFDKQWVFRQVELTLVMGKTYVVLGANGSGKSTLLQVVSGFVTPTEGRVIFENGKTIATEKMFQEIACAAPYLEIYEEFDIKEALIFHQRYKKLSHSVEDIIKDIGLPSHKPISTFSSGMKQKVKLALALYTDRPILLLDEPTSNLDASTKKWYENKVNKIKEERLLLVCSNYQKEEYDLDHEEIIIENYKEPKK